ncbi:hypothetical protein AAHN97_12070 [Chitinophaga niabensis]
MEFIIPDFADASVWISLITLCFLEVVLGIDNIRYNLLLHNRRGKSRR